MGLGSPEPVARAENAQRGLAGGVTKKGGSAAPNARLRGGASRMVISPADPAAPLGAAD
jgi:hypothetical protein